MFVLPVGNTLKKRKVPIATILIILINCWVFFFLQQGREEQDQIAHDYYFSTKLPDWEFESYRAYLGKHGDSTDVFRFEQILSKNRIVALRKMERNGPFMRELRADLIVTAQDANHEQWKKLRDRYESMLSFTSAHVFKVFDPNFRDALYSMFMHGWWDHLFWNMAFLFVIGSLVEPVVGKTIFCLSYLVSGFAALAMYYATGSPDSTALGASGAIAGVMGMSSVLFGFRKINVFYSVFFYFDFVRAPAIILLPLWLGKELFRFLLEQDSRVAFMAHFGGLLCGALLAGLFRIFKSVDAANDLVPVESIEADKQAYKRGIDYLGSMEFGKASREFEALLSKHPNDIKLAQMAFQTAKFDPSSESYHTAALRLFSFTRHADLTATAINTLFHEYMTNAKPSPRLGHSLVLELVRVFSEGGFASDAEKLHQWLQNVAPSHPGHPSALLALAKGYYRENRKEDFLATLRNLTDGYPGSDEAKSASKLMQASY